MRQYVLSIVLSKYLDSFDVVYRNIFYDKVVHSLALNQYKYTIKDNFEVRENNCFFGILVELEVILKYIVHYYCWPTGNYTISCYIKLVTMTGHVTPYETLKNTLKKN